MALAITVEHRAFHGVPYVLVRTPRRKTAAILIAPGGHVTVRVPQALDEATIDALLETRRNRLLRAVTDLAGVPEREARDFAEGATFLFLGREHSLRFVDQGDADLTLDAGGFHLLRQSGVSAEAKYQAAFRRFYCEQGRRHIGARVAHFAQLLGVSPTATRVLHLGNRWGSCSPKGAVNFHWRAMMAPPEVVDYLVVHELAHLKVPGHSRDFWRIVEVVVPDHVARHAWLREHGAFMDV